MRSRALVLGAAVFATLLAWSPVRAQDNADRFSGGLVPGDYVRLGYADVNPVHPEGALRDWKRGNGVDLLWENWDIGRSGGVARLGFGIQGSYSTFPFNEQQFIADFVNGPFGHVLTATAKSASIIQVGVTTRLRVPMPIIIPSVAVGFGFINWRPGEIRYTAVGGTGTAKQQNRSGASISFSGGLDAHVIDRFFLFADAAYTYGYTSFGSGLAGSGSACLQADCDLLKNTQLGILRGGLRVHVGR
jgi:hypothetical protein